MFVIESKESHLKWNGLELNEFELINAKFNDKIKQYLSTPMTMAANKFLN